MHAHAHTRMNDRARTHTRARAHARRRARAHTQAQHTRTQAHTNTHTRTHAHEHTRAHTHKHPHAPTPTHARTHARTHTQTHTHTHARTHASTHTHTRTRTLHETQSPNLAVSELERQRLGNEYPIRKLRNLEVYLGAVSCPWAGGKCATRKRRRRNMPSEMKLVDDNGLSCHLANFPARLASILGWGDSVREPKVSDATNQAYHRTVKRHFPCQSGENTMLLSWRIAPLFF